MNDATIIAGLILCGGRSSRMGGGEKCLLPLGGRSMLDAALERAARQATPIAISANGDPRRFLHPGIPVLPDPVPNFAGPLSGVLAGLEWAGGLDGCAAMMSFAGDTPFFPDTMVQRLAAAASSCPGCIAVAASGGRRHPVFALWPLSLRQDLRDFLLHQDRRSVAAFQELHPVVQVDFPQRRTRHGTFDPFFNVNTPEDLAEAKRIAEDIEA